MIPLLRSEWTKFRTVRGWVAGSIVAVLLTVGVGLLGAAGTVRSCQGPQGDVCPEIPIGPGGQAVHDRFSFYHRALPGDGSITVKVADVSGVITYPPPDHDKIVPGVVPWAKVGVMVKQDLRQGSAYAAVMVTGAHGTRVQDDFVNDLAAGGDPWLRLTRSGDTLKGESSPDGTSWRVIAERRLKGPALIGLFAASPCDVTLSQGALGGTIGACRLTNVTGKFEDVSVEGASGTWTHDDVGGEIGAPTLSVGSARVWGSTIQLTGSGDISPAGMEGGAVVERTLTGASIGLIAVIVVGVLFVTAEYRRGLIKATLAANPGRTGVLLAKAAVVATVTFAGGLVAAALAVPVGIGLMRDRNNSIAPITALTEVRVIVGTAALLAVTAVLALALGAIFRRSAAAVIAAIMLVLLPQLLATASVIPSSAAQWLLRVTPAAGFAIQQSIPAYPQVEDYYIPALGYYPLPPLGGFAVMCGYAAVALAGAIVVLRRRDA
ncbi:ABC transporter permease subunit [Herbidospora mongoliensis]|uniref:ABC transporter permease subunit n=1 Tax=Herbidospora mongoliensis TaxID=688067 RepID=UPI00082EFE3A|nr:ABC transporter permease subunit [Herbidospora mongoliensis]